MIATSLSLRPFRADDADYAALVDIWNAVHSDSPETVDQHRFDDRARDPECLFARVIAEDGGRVVGVGTYGQNEGMRHPGRFFLDAQVQPGVQGRGVGAALYAHMLAALGPLQPRALHAKAREDHARALNFLSERGFAEDKRDWESQLEVAAFDPAPYAGLEERLRAEGLVLTTLAELAADPEMPRKLYELFSEVRLDIPRSEAPTPIAFECLAHVQGACKWITGHVQYDIPQPIALCLNMSRRQTAPYLSPPEALMIKACLAPGVL